MKYSLVYIVALLCLSCSSLWAQNNAQRTLPKDTVTIILFDSLGHVINQEGDSGDYIEPSGGIGGNGSTIDTNEVFAYVDEFPYFKNGDINEYIKSNFIFTKEILNSGTPGVLYISFVVERNGSLSEIKIVPGKCLTTPQNNEAIRVITTTKGSWIPAKINGFPVRCKIKQAFRFTPEDFSNQK